MEGYIDCRILIKQQYSAFHSSEKKIADFILQHPEEIVDMTVAQLASKIGTAESSIVRFCQILGLKGFIQLKINMARNMVPDARQVYGNISQTDSCGSVVQKIFASSVKVLEDTGRFLSMEHFREAIELLSRARRIEVYGVYTSAMIAQDAGNRLRRIGYPVYAYTDPYEAKISAGMLGPGDTVLGISHTGRTKDTVDTLQIAGRAGASVISVTSTPNSSIVKVSDIPLVICSDEQQIFRECITSRLAHIVLLDAVCVCLGLMHYEETARRMAVNSDVINQMRY